MSTARVAHAITTVSVVPLERAGITPDPDNAGLHTPRNIGVIEDSMQSDGVGRSILVDQDGVTIAGAGAWEAATPAGIARAAIIETDGDTLVVVKRTVTPEQRLRLALADVLARVVAEPLHGLTDADAVPPERSTPIQRGDLFALGAHRLLCGDSTDTADVSRVLDGRRPLLMVTDPRYGVDYDPAWRARAGVNENTRKLGRVTNDDRADWTETWRLFPGDVAYVWHGGLRATIVQDSAGAIRLRHPRAGRLGQRSSRLLTWRLSLAARAVLVRRTGRRDRAPHP